ncbi:MAG: P-II family nitrogen regulator [Candidatus Margulisbacteria bacterium]|nr:P-II family nitrogen regulator [Candidatus Margulisiibacteriota bacterium]
MKLIKAYVRPKIADQVIHALEKAKPFSIEAADVKVIGDGVFELEKNPDGQVSIEYGAVFFPMTKLEIICHDEEVKRILKVLEEKGRTGRERDGFISVSRLAKVIKLHTKKEEK